VTPPPRPSDASPSRYPPRYPHLATPVALTTLLSSSVYIDWCCYSRVPSEPQVRSPRHLRELGGPTELPQGTAVVIPRPVGDTADDACFSVPPPPLGRCPSTPVDGERADAVRKRGAGAAARGARTARVTWSGPHGRRGRPCRSPKRHRWRGHPYRGKPRA